jgi:hypothetical protein
VCVCVSDAIVTNPLGLFVEANLSTRPATFQKDRSQDVTIESSDSHFIQTPEADGKCSVHEMCTVCHTHVQHTLDFCARPTRQLARVANCVYDLKHFAFPRTF